jgi:chaperone BCS1
MIEILGIKEGMFCHHLSFVFLILKFFFFGFSLTLSGLLNIVDGVGAGEGRIMVATTNYYDRLDEALIRPGRIDLEVKFELASKYQAREQFSQFYLPSITKEKEPGPTLSSTDQGTDESPTTTTALAEKYFEDEDLHLDDFTTRISRLADEFVEDFPEYVISSASLQQYLLMHKSGPIEAVAKFKTWVQAEMERKERKQNEALALPMPVPESQLDAELPDI